MPFLIGIVVASALLEVIAEASGKRRAVYVLKPLTTSLIVVLALALPNPVSTFYGAAIVLGLLFSLMGDVFLMLPSDRFVAGLTSFLLAHLCYIAAFSSAAGSLSVVAVALLLAWGGLLLWLLWPELGKLRAPVTLYSAVLLVMAWTAIGQSSNGQPGRAALAAGGALLFVASDSALALDRFVRKDRRLQLLVLSTYFAAQLLIALSVRAR